MGHDGGSKADSCPERQQPYRTLAVVAVAAWLAAVPVLSLLGYRRLAVIWLALEVLALAVIRVQRPDGTWIAARSRGFDVVFGLLLAVGLFALSYYAGLPRVH
ncbi:DUF3017 domain-containing protein [Actinomyces sp. 432]|uniref:DUF3017 domain-containing protein n=1 Tax=Actinomyces sp. 432 TaxID=2057798 RepID=UPI0013738BB0|nr:DUF3017 domain-containing protein [Actinomyces sp. 432]MBW3069838.1 DUF3017 domain-containing protein [Actinomyces sp. 594]NDR53901.1 DUF3017 domain-containing protein [Actinomyces sp. 565]QHO92177.1 DUF3017 domain-containing protein [Actinomyces sp. 432]